MRRAQILPALALAIFVSVSESKAEVNEFQLNVWANAACSSNDDIGKKNCALLNQAKEAYHEQDIARMNELLQQVRANNLGVGPNLADFPINQRQQHEKAVGNPNWRQY